jgi:hypothetical protein
MAEPTPSLTEIAPDTTPPSSTRPAVTPLTREQMSAELGKNLRAPGTDKPAPRQEPKAEAASDADRPREYTPKNEQKPPLGKLPDLREALRESMDKKAEKPAAEAEKPKPVKVVSADEAAPPKPTANEEVPEDQRQVLPHDKPETARRIRALLDDKKKLAKELEDARKVAVAKPTENNVEEFNKLKEEHTKATDELLKFRRRYEVDNDETFKKTYDEPVSHAEASIESTLKKYQLGDTTFKAIKDEGGFAAFSRSSKTFQVQQKGEDGEMRTVQITAGELARQWLDKIPVADAEFIKQSLGKQQMLTEEKKTAVQRAVDESKQFFEQRQLESKKQQDAAKASEAELTKKYQDWYKTATESTEWLKDKDVPENASEAQKKQIKETNEFNKQLRDGLNSHPKTSEEYYTLRMEAAETHHLRREMGSREERIKSLEAELSRVKGGTRTTPKAGSLLTDNNREEKKPEVDMSNPVEAMKKGLRASMAKKSGSIEDE